MYNIRPTLLPGHYMYTCTLYTVHYALAIYCYSNIIDLSRGHVAHHPNLTLHPPLRFIISSKKAILTFYRLIAFFLLVPLLFSCRKFLLCRQPRPLWFLWTAQKAKSQEHNKNTLLCVGFPPSIPHYLRAQTHESVFLCAALCSLCAAAVCAVVCVVWCVVCCENDDAAARPSSLAYLVYYIPQQH